ncbi:LysR substrate-binding domain-containing protein, partial [Comamonas sp. B-9]
ISNQQYALQQLCSEGLGLARLFSLEVADQVRSGQLLRLLPDWDCGSLRISALTPERQALPARVRLALAALQAHFAPLALS